MERCGPPTLLGVGAPSGRGGTWAPALGGLERWAGCRSCHAVAEAPRRRATRGRRRPLKRGRNPSGPASLPAKPRGPQK